MEYGFYSGILMFMMVTVVSMISLIITRRKYGRYLRENYTENCEYLASTVCFGIGFWNSLKGVKFLFSRENIGDPELSRLRFRFKWSIIYTVTSLVGVFIMVFITAKFS